MPCNKMPFTWFVVSVLQGLGFLLSLIGYGSNFITWTGLDENYAHCGLWKICNPKVCYDTKVYVDGEVWVDASRAMMSMAIIAQFFTIILTSSGLRWAVTKLSGRITAGLATFSALNGFIGLAVVTGESKKTMSGKHDLSISVGWSFTLFIIGQCLFLLAAAWHFIDARNKT